MRGWERIRREQVNPGQIMTFRRKLLAVFTLTVLLSVGGVSWLGLVLTRIAFEKTEEQHRSALATQFQHEFSRRGEDVARRVAAIAASEAVNRMATALVGTTSDSSGYFELARSLAESQQLDFLEFVGANGKIISSAQWPAKFGYQDATFQNLVDSAGKRAFLKQEELQESTALGLFAVRTAGPIEHLIYLAGGRRLDRDFLSGLDLPAELRVLLYQNRGDHFSPDALLGPAGAGTDAEARRPPEKLAGLIDSVRQANEEKTEIISWSSAEADQEIFHAIPLRGTGKDRPLLAILLVGNSRRSYVELKERLRASAVLVGVGGIFLAIVLSNWAAARVTRPVEQLARAAREVAAGRWETRVDVRGGDEVAQLAESFNRMTAELEAQKERLVQTERVAAWRELARRLAHELKNPLFPLQLTVENLMRARVQSPEQFEEVFQESSSTLLAEISNLKTIIGRFSEFSKMPQPQLQTVSVNEMVLGVAKLFQAQLQAPDRAPIASKLELDDSLPAIAADPELLHRALSNLVLNAMDAMPSGGTLTLRTRRGEGKISIEVGDTGSGLTREECERIFTPYYTSKLHGTGLGLAIVQSVVSDHGGRSSVQSEPGRGTTFVIELPDNLEALQKLTTGENATNS